ncbi:MAG: O-antigen ligase family protein [Cellvibrio sp.]|nr:O-antigen ligase family protein [Cellvibrio sp.]
MRSSDSFGEKKLEKIAFRWSSFGLLVFIFSFLWSPSRDGIQGLFALLFFLPVFFLLLTSGLRLKFYGGWAAFSALAFGGFSAFSTTWSKQPDIAFQLIQLVTLTAWLCGARLIFEKREVELINYILWFVALGSLTILLSVVYYFLFLYVPSYAEARFSGWNVFRNQNEVGAFSGILTLLSITIALSADSKGKFYAFYFFSACAATGLIASFSRGALLAFVIMLAILIILYRPACARLFPLMLTFGLFVLCLFFLYPNAFDFGTRGYHIGLRSAIWSHVYESFKTNQLVGIGLSKNTTISIEGMAYNHAHSAWLDTIYRTGIIGISLFLWHLRLVFKLKLSPAVEPLLFLWLGYGLLFNLFDGRCFFGELGAKWFFYWIPIGLIIAYGSSATNKKIPS